jgi:enoyl-[acyl-carrier-protein] reductase (NADH)
MSPGDSRPMASVVMPSALEVRTIWWAWIVLMTHMLKGVQTNITQSINLDDIDHEAHATIQPVIDLHLDQASGTTIAKAELLANVLLFLVSDMSKEISGAIIPVDHAWSTI